MKILTYTSIAIISLGLASCTQSPNTHSVQTGEIATATPTSHKEITSVTNPSMQTGENLSTETHNVQPQEQAFYLDVREDSEWQEWHVEWAKHIPLGEILAGKRLDEIPKDREVRVYCRSGRRSGEAIKHLEKHGFTNLVNAGGMKDLTGVNIVK